MEMAFLRLIHLVAGVIWGGGAIASGWIFLPAVIEAGPSGGAVMKGVLARKFPVWMAIASFLAILTGLRMYSIFFSAAWIATGHGIVITLGGLLAIGAFGIGVGVARPSGDKLVALAATIAGQGGPPTPEQAKEMGELSQKLAKANRLIAWHLAGTVLLMSAARLASSF